MVDSNVGGLQSAVETLDLEMGMMEFTLLAEADAKAKLTLLLPEFKL